MLIDLKLVAFVEMGCEMEEIVCETSVYFTLAQLTPRWASPGSIILTLYQIPVFPVSARASAELR